MFRITFKGEPCPEELHETDAVARARIKALVGARAASEARRGLPSGSFGTVDDWDVEEETGR